MSKTQRSNNQSTTLEPVTIPALSTTLTSDLPDRQVCTVRALRHYLDRTNPDRKSKNTRLFIAYKEGYKGDITKNTLIGWMNATIREAYINSSPKNTNLEPLKLQARELRAYGTTLAFNTHHSLTQVMNAAPWRASGTFGQFYYRDNPSMLEGISSLGPIVASKIVARFSSFTNKSRAHCSSTGTARSTVKGSAKTLNKKVTTQQSQ